jgi:hypothetical protein
LYRRLEGSLIKVVSSIGSFVRLEGHSRWISKSSRTIFQSQVGQAPLATRINSSPSDCRHEESDEYKSDNFDYGYASKDAPQKKYRTNQSEQGDGFA